MILIDYEVACRSCMIADNIGRSILFKGDLERFYEGKTMKSEYKIATSLSDILNTKEDACSYCGSYNLEFSNIEIDGKIPRIDSKATLFQLTISTTSSGDVSIKNRGSQYVPPGFLKEAFEL